jgi:hypothetical protein
VRLRPVSVTLLNDGVVDDMIIVVVAVGCESSVQPGITPGAITVLNHKTRPSAKVLTVGLLSPP